MMFSKSHWTYGKPKKKKKFVDKLLEERREVQERDSNLRCSHVISDDPAAASEESFILSILSDILQSAA